jgi:hypothetical protein
LAPASLRLGTPPRSLLCSSRSPARRFAPATIDLLCFNVLGLAPLSSQVSSSPSLAFFFFLSSLAAPTLVFRDRTERSPDPGSVSGFTNLFPLLCLVLAPRFSFSWIQLLRLRFLLVMAPFVVLSVGFRTFFCFGVFVFGA